MIGAEIRNELRLWRLLRWVENGESDHADSLPDGIKIPAIERGFCLR